MGSVSGGFGGKPQKANNVGFQIGQFLGSIQYENTLKILQSPRRGIRVPATDFIDRKDGCEQTESKPLILPPGMGGLLIDGDGLMTAGPGGQILSVA